MDGKIDLKFKPINEGLGFHPFSDGLPYAPSTHAPTAGAKPAQHHSGAGATAAGRPVFLTRSGSEPGPTTMDDPRIEKIRRDLESLNQIRTTPARAHTPLAPSIPKRPASAPTTLGTPAQRMPHASAARPAATASRPALEIRHGLGYSFQRVIAYFIDTALNLSLCASVLSMALLRADLENSAFFSPMALSIAFVFLFLCNWAGIVAQEVAFGTSIGKRIFGLRLPGDGSGFVLRAVLFVPSLLFSGLGLVMAIFDQKKRCWHDRMTGIQPEAVQ